MWPVNGTVTLYVITVSVNNCLMWSYVRGPSLMLYARMKYRHQSHNIQAKLHRNSVTMSQNPSVRVSYCPGIRMTHCDNTSASEYHIAKISRNHNDTLSQYLSVEKSKISSLFSFSGWTMRRHTWCCGPEQWIHPYSFSIFHERWRSSWTIFTSVMSRARSRHPIPMNRAPLDTIPLVRPPWTNQLLGFTWRTGVSMLSSSVMQRTSR